LLPTPLVDEINVEDGFGGGDWSLSLDFNLNGK